jgi:uncharacterized protein (TIGR03118 family)
MSLSRLSLLASAALVLALPASRAAAVEFIVHNLASDGTVPAANPPDANLQNPWGVAFGPKSPFWISDNHTNLATLYDGTGAKLGLTVNVPGAPTGPVFNGTASSFSIDGAKPAFIFDGEDGTISGWEGGTGVHTAIITSDGAVYKGLAIASDGAGDHLYATDFHNGEVEMYTNTFAAGPTSFTDPSVAAGYAPFNAQVLGGQLFVTFALQDDTAHDDVAGVGHGYVDVFNLDGTFNRRIASLGDAALNSPWGLAIAPSSFGNLAGDLLVGNFGDGTISAFDLATNHFDGKLRGTDGQVLQFGDLWALTPGNGFAAGSTQKIYFTAGLSDEAHGLFGSLTATPEPDSWALMILGFGLAGMVLRGRRPLGAA